METKEIKIQAPKGFEIDKENSTFECIKFKFIKKDITYKDVCKVIFGNDEKGFYIQSSGDIEKTILHQHLFDENNATNKKQLNKILALNQLLNIAEYYNGLHSTAINTYTIAYNKVNKMYNVDMSSSIYSFGIKAFFNRKEDAQAVIDNPNFREVLDTIYK